MKHLSIRLRLICKKKIFRCHIGCVGRMSRKVFDTNKKQITEPVRKLRDESNDTN
jgi:hypothetical protein